VCDEFQHSWATACSRARQGGDGEAYIYQEDNHERLGLERKDGTAASAETWLGLCVLCV
jgi:hypothetical protein